MTETPTSNPDLAIVIIKKTIWPHLPRSNSNEDSADAISIAHDVYSNLEQAGFTIVQRALLESTEQQLAWATSQLTESKAPRPTQPQQHAPATELIAPRRPVPPEGPPSRVVKEDRIPPRN